ncbi:MAG: cobalamin-dependent protein [bacterium]
MQPSPETITAAVVQLELERIAALVREALAAGVEPLSVLQAMSAGVVKVGELFEQGKYYLVDLVIAGQIMKEGLEILGPHLAVENLGKKGTVVLCTVKGDVHDIGKNLVANMLKGSGFRVVDLGVDVPPEKVVEAVRVHAARALGLSVLLTPMVQSVADTVAALCAAGLRDGLKIAIGGACTTPELARRLGVDAVGQDPVEAIRIFERFLA